MLIGRAVDSELGYRQAFSIGAISDNSAMPQTIRDIAVFCASADGADPIYRAVAAELGWALARRDIGIVYGGAKVGLMQAVAEAALAEGGRVVGVIPTVLVNLEVAHDGLTELHITENMHTRKALMGERSDAFIVLPGGFGTFEELFEVLAWQTLKIHDKPVLLVNVNGFYDKLLVFLDHCVAQGMLRERSRGILLVANTINEALRMLHIAELKPEAK
jgi:uncharacterized protein (TIGR00730 family)